MCGTVRLRLQSRVGGAARALAAACGPVCASGDSVLAVPAAVMAVGIGIDGYGSMSIGGFAAVIGISIGSTSIDAMQQRCM